MPSTPNITLVGFMGTGKSAVSRTLAKRLGWERVDTDEMIVLKAGKTIPQIFAEDGEPHFRDLETEVISDLDAVQNTVISTGGGAVLRDQNMAMLNALGLTVNLGATVEVILKRCGTGQGRPLLNVPDPEGRVRELLAQRAEHYAKAQVTVDTSDLTIDEVVDAILKHAESGDE